MKTIFEKIVQKEVVVDIVFENKRLVVIEDIAPLAPVHLLLLPKTCYISLDRIPPEESGLLSDVVQVIQQLAKRFKLDRDGYRVVTNCGLDGGQEIAYLHFHLLGGKRLGRIA